MLVPAKKQGLHAERGVGWIRTILKAAAKKRWEDRAHDVRKGEGPQE